MHFQYLYVGLPALDAVKYVGGDNWLGVALSALVQIARDRIAWLWAEAMRRLQTAPLTDQQRFLLAECVQAYLPLDDDQRREFERLIHTAPFQGVQAMNTTWYEKGVEKGRRDILRKQLTRKFGPLSANLLARLDQMTSSELEALSEALLTADSLADLGLETLSA